MATTTATATVELVPADEALGVAERVAIAGFLAGYTGNTLISYTADLRLLVQTGLGSPRDHALISLLALNGLRISETLGADVESLDMDRGHRTLAIVRKGGKHVIIRSRPGLRERSTCTSASERAGRSSSARTASGWTATPLTAR
jgi:hypothetical protein